MSTKGMAVVDYFLCPTDHFDMFNKFKVYNPLDIINNNNIPIDSKIPDHRILTISVKLPITNP